MDGIDKEKAVRAHLRLGARLARHFAAWPWTVVLLAACYTGYVAAGFSAHASERGGISGLPLQAPVRIYRDARGIPHVRARDEWGAFFAQGFVQGQDRLFQMDLIRRYAYGRLSEMLGPIQLTTDEKMRTFDIRDIAQREWRRLPARDRFDLEAFSAGVNAAMRLQPLPLEFRLLLYRPAPWTPRDSLAVALAVAITVEDSPDNVIARDALWRSTTPAQYARMLPLSDPAYDVAADSTLARTNTRLDAAVLASHAAIPVPAAGSNAWAAGGAHESAGHALLANDPHLSPSIPGVWYCIEIRAPGIHVAGVTIPGLPGVALGHNEHVAWATTNGMVSTLTLYAPSARIRYAGDAEHFHVRFAADVTHYYYRSAHDFAVRIGPDRFVLARWPQYDDPRSAVTTILALDRASGVVQALRALRGYNGPPQNFALADDGGRVAYHLAGQIHDDPAWGRYVHAPADLRRSLPLIPFDRLPFIAPSRRAIVVSANNKMYSGGYALRLSPMFAPPYRAYRIAELLHARSTYDIGYFARMQLDAVSPADADFAHALARYALRDTGVLSRDAIEELRAWNGAYSPKSRAATLEHDLRDALEASGPSPYAPFALIGNKPPSGVLQELRWCVRCSGSAPWRAAGRTQMLHPFGSIGFPFLNAQPLPGWGDRYTIHVQTGDYAQSFRAVWRTGDWDRGGLSLPAGESGEIGSAHYDDQRSAWIAGMLVPLPFSDAAVGRAARAVLTLRH